MKGRLNCSVFGGIAVPEEMESWLLHQEAPNMLQAENFLAVFKGLLTESAEGLVRGREPVPKQATLFMMSGELEGWAFGTNAHVEDVSKPFFVDQFQTRFGLTYIDAFDSYVSISTAINPSGQLFVVCHSDDGISGHAHVSLLHQEQPGVVLQELIIKETRNASFEADPALVQPLANFSPPGGDGRSIWDGFLSSRNCSHNFFHFLDVSIRSQLLPDVSIAAACMPDPSTYTRYEVSGPLMDGLRNMYLSGLMDYLFRPIVDEVNRHKQPKLPAPSTSATEPKFACPSCAVSFKRKYDMQRHANSVHNRVRQFNCPQCSKSFAQTSHVRVHVETVHHGRRSQACDQCNQTFGTKEKLARHRRAVHVKERSCICSVCGKSFFQNSDLRRHCRAKHADVENFPTAASDGSVAFAGEFPGMGTEAPHDKLDKLDPPSDVETSQPFARDRSAALTDLNLNKVKVAVHDELDPSSDAETFALPVRDELSVFAVAPPKKAVPTNDELNLSSSLSVPDPDLYFDSVELELDTLLP
mmetsp:Transcript_219/g.690  ORF Transcript_219/g.690 Transcript_219/m.690 type:complete len:528 (+) Transcript_219:134-1717(+)